MDVSLFTQYYLRRLQSQVVDERQSSAPQFSIATAPGGIDLSQVLATFTARSARSAPTIRELESLIQMYQALEGRLTQEASRLEEVRRRIWRLLDLQASAIAACRLPTVLEEDAIASFCFYYNHQVQVGMRHQQRFYGVVQQLPQHAKFMAYQLAWLLQEQQIEAVLTVSPESYKLWVDLRSPAYNTLMQQGPQVLQVALSLQALIAAQKQRQPTQR